MSTQNLKEAGLKVTLPRLRVLEVLEASEHRHLSAEEVYKRLIEADSEVGLATVYRVLTQFESAGLVSRRHFDGGQALFELNDDDDHSHIVCVKTGHVEEFNDPIIEQRLLEISEELGYTMNDHTIVVYGERNKVKTGKAGR